MIDNNNDDVTSLQTFAVINPNNKLEYAKDFFNQTFSTD